MAGTNDDTLGASGPRGRVTAGCLFSGMGGFATGLAKAGFTVAWGSDNNEFATRTFRHRFPGVHFVEKDARGLTFDEDGLENIDVLAAGFPCQSFSQAGERQGFDDFRGEVFFEIPRLIGGLPAECRPKLLLLENVPYLRHGGGGQWFDMIQRALRKAGYWFRDNACWIANVKDYTDIPQDRERLYMVAASRHHFTRNPFTGEGMKHHRSEGTRPLSAFVDRSAKEMDTQYLSEHNRYYKLIADEMDAGDGIDNIYQLRRFYVRKKNGLSPTLTANMGGGGHNVPFIKDEWGIRKLSVDEVARLQGFATDTPLFPEDVPANARYRLVGNAAHVGLSQLIASACREILEGVPND